MRNYRAGVSDRVIIEMLRPWTITEEESVTITQAKSHIHIHTVPRRKESNEHTFILLYPLD